MRLLAVMCAALAIAPAASALPEGFRISARLTPRAQQISGGIGQIACPSSWTAWLEFQRAHGIDSGSGGMTLPNEQTAYLAPDLCVTLERWLRGKAPQTTELFAESAQTFIHEAIHLRGITDERAADCTALTEFKRWTRTLLGVKNAKKLAAMFRYAVAANRRLPDEYRC